MKRILVGISGASGALYAKCLLEALASPEAQSQGGLEVHLIVSAGAEQVLRHEKESGVDAAYLKSLAHAVHDPADIAAPPASGSFPVHAMAICPCSMSTLAAIAGGCGTNLLHRAADVTLKEGRPLLLVTRETPLSRIHLQNMLRAAESGAIIMPPCPACYAGLSTLEDAARHFAGRVLDRLSLPGPAITRWKGGAV